MTTRLIPRERLEVCERALRDADDARKRLEKELVEVRAAAQAADVETLRPGDLLWFTVEMVAAIEALKASGVDDVTVRCVEIRVMPDGTKHVILEVPSDASAEVSVPWVSPSASLVSEAGPEAIVPLSHVPDFAASAPPRATPRTVPNDASS